MKRLMAFACVIVFIFCIGCASACAEGDSWICPECGSYNDGWMHICDTCSYDPAVLIRKNRNAAVRRRILSGLRVVLFVVIACALALGCYYLGRSIRDGFASSAS